MEWFKKSILSLFISISGIIYTYIVFAIRDNLPESFANVFCTWLIVGFFLVFIPKKVGKMIMITSYSLLLNVVLLGTLYFTGAKIIGFMNEEPDSVCSYDCDQPIPDTSDLIDSVTPSGDNNHSPGYHNVDGHYRGGTYVEPYTRSNPDGDPSNNIND